ncbi:MAG: LysE family translocator [Alphaproteobacteria bacterium]|nr:LysE family translocator [Alphaproteobacteria bacterium]MBU2084499.1 LysE family translocator [Alphaproteobacteria bacterium]MBU2142507.1 LysE family translocator [Alphaproteobacteria bacterium]MBU2197740.1 LysE family translocator [Alphaproteobacteria bacterium]
MPVELLLALAAFAFVASITPGPNNLMLMASGTNFGLRRTLPHMIGVNIGFVLMLLLVGLGLAQVFDAYPVSYTVLKTVSALYLLYLAWKIATASPPPTTSGEAQAGKPLTFLQAAAFQWVNPKAWAMVLTGMSAYTLPERPLVSLAIVTIVFGLVNLPSIFTWAVMGTQVRRFLNKPARLRAFNITAALLLVATIWPIMTSSGLGAH